MFFSIIIPTYNRADLIVKTLLSILSQTYNDYEVLIIDDGSTDDTEQRVNAFITEHSCSHFKYFKKENAERGAARNYGLQYAGGQYVTFLDSDDLLYPDHLHAAFTFIAQQNYPELVHQAYEFNNAKNEIPYAVKYPPLQHFNSHLVTANYLSCFGVFLRHDIATQHPFNTDRAFSGSEDWLLWLQLAARFKIYFNPKVTGCLVQHEARSVLHFTDAQLLYRANTLYSILKTDSVFLKAFGASAAKRVYGHMLTYTALHLMLSKTRKKSVLIFIKGIYYAPAELFTKRSLAVLKHFF